MKRILSLITLIIISLNIQAQDSTKRETGLKYKASYGKVYTVYFNPYKGKAGQYFYMRTRQARFALPAPPLALK